MCTRKSHVLHCISHLLPKSSTDYGQFYDKSGPKVFTRLLKEYEVLMAELYMVSGVCFMILQVRLV